MASPMSTLSPEKLNSQSAHSIPIEDEISWHEPPSSPFVSYIDDQENIAPAHTVAATPVKSLIDFSDDAPQSAFKISSPLKTSGLKERISPTKMPSSASLLDDGEDATLGSSIGSRSSPKKASPVKQTPPERPESAMSNRSRRTLSPIKSSRTASVESVSRLPESASDAAFDIVSTPIKRPASSHIEPALRENEGLTVAIQVLEESHSETHERSTTYHNQIEISEIDYTGMDDTDMNPDGPDFTSLDVGIDDTCFSNFSEMPGIDMTKFAALKKSPTHNRFFDQVRKTDMSLLT